MKINSKLIILLGYFDFYIFRLYLGVNISIIIIVRFTNEYAYLTKPTAGLKARDGDNHFYLLRT